MNQLLYKERRGDSYYGILLTPCWPCCYFSGRIVCDDEGHWWAGYNGTGFFRTEDEAINALVVAINGLVVP
jgi:hypothetical protein